MVEEKFNLKSEYLKLKNRFSDLPEFEDINNEFEIISIDKIDFLSRKIRRIITDKIIALCKILENIIYPNLQNNISNYETSFFTEEEREKVVILHKNLMTFERWSLNLDVLALSEEKDIEYILEVNKEINNLKKEISEVVLKMKNSWKEELKDDGERYFG